MTRTPWVLAAYNADIRHAGTHHHAEAAHENKLRFFRNGQARNHLTITLEHTILRTPLPPRLVRRYSSSGVRLP